MSKQTENILRIINAGGNVIIKDSTGKSEELFMAIAQAAVANDVHVTFGNCIGHNTDKLVSIAQIGGKHVTFEV